MHHAVGQRAGLARSRPRDHQEGRRVVGRRRTNAVLAAAVLANAVLDGAALVGVELVERGRIALLEAKQDEPCSVFVRNRDHGVRGWPGVGLSCVARSDDAASPVQNSTSSSSISSGSVSAAAVHSFISGIAMMVAQ
jgi:hypothetical protein